MWRTFRTRSACFVLVLMAAALALVDGRASGETADEQQAVEAVKATWKEILDQFSRGDPNLEKWSETDWGQFAVIARDHFQTMLKKSPEPRASLKWYSEQFGNTDAMSDFLWMLAAEPYAAPGYDGKLFAPIPAGRGPDFGRPCQLILAECQCRQFIKSRALLERYAYFLAWRNQWLCGDCSGWNRFARYAGQIAEKFSPADEDYWWHARQFLVIALVTGRDDLIPTEEKELSELHKQFAKWLEWFRKNGCYLRPAAQKPIWYLDNTLRDSGYGYVKFFEGYGQLPPWQAIPKGPFPDWRGPALPSRSGYFP